MLRIHFGNIIGEKMALDYISSTVTEEEYVQQRGSRSEDTASSLKSTLTNVKLFTQNFFNRDFYIVMADLKRESEKSQSVDATLVFMQKFVTWIHDEHPGVMMRANQYRDVKPFQSKSSVSIRNYIGQLRKYLKRVGGIPVSSEDVSDYIIYPEDEEREEAEPLDPSELRIIIDNQKSFRRKMLYKITKDTCSRIRAMCGLRRENVNIDVRPIEITFPKHIMKGKKRTVVKFVTLENEEDFLRFLKDYKDPRELLFGTNKVGKIAATTEQKIWSKLVKKLGFTDTYRHNGRLKKNIHSIKAFTETAAEEAVDAFYANAYGDHENYLAQYIRWSYDKKIRKFRAMEPLINLYTTIKEIHDDEKLLEENKFLKSKINNIEDQLKMLADDKKESTKTKLNADQADQIIKILTESKKL